MLVTLFRCLALIPLASMAEANSAGMPTVSGNAAMVASKIVSLDYADLVAGKDLTADIERAFSYDGLGILTVVNVPNLAEKRKALLPLARTFAELPEDVKQRYERPDTFFSFGWSHGREKLQGKPDYAKGSYYANPQYDRPVDDEALIKQFAPFIHPNVWPTEDLPLLEPGFKALGQLVVEVGALVGKQCDAYVKSKCSGYEDFKLFEIISTSKCCKARLLHYFSKDSVGGAKAAAPAPLQDAPAEVCEVDGEAKKQKTSPSPPDDAFSDWCGWHNDHGSLTGLVPALYLDASGAEIPNPDPDAGLYIRSRSGQLVRAVMPPGGSSLAFQIGETAQIHSGGLLQATPHAVRGADGPGVTRETFAVFMEPNWDGDMAVPAGRTVEEAQNQAAAASLPKEVPPLGSRWKEGMDFGEFTDATLNSYY